MNTVIFDIQRLVKQVYVFDAQDNMIFSDSAENLDTTDDDGFPADDLVAICAWIDETLYELSIDFEIAALNFCCYGASLVHLDRQGRATTPLYSSAKPVAIPNLHHLYRSAGGPHSFHVVTGSPSLGMSNSGLQLLWLQHVKSAAFAQTQHTLHLPQYLSYRFSNQLCSDFSSVGAHTCLWDFGRGKYHNWLADNKFEVLVPKVSSSFTTFNGLFYSSKIKVGIGVQREVASLSYHLSREHAPFLLVHTGTKAICFNPFNHLPLTAYELSNECLSFLSYEGEAIKAAQCCFGLIHQTRLAELNARYEVHPELYKLVRYVEALDPKNLKSQRSRRKLLTADENTSERKPEFDNFNSAYHALMRELINQLHNRISLVATEEAAKHIIIDGEFAENALFCEMLRAFFPRSKFSVIKRINTSALGALAALKKTD